MRAQPVAAALAFALAANAPASDWPRWLGPNQNGSTTAAGALGKPDLKLRKAWRRAIGGGRGGVVVEGGRVFAIVTDGERQQAIAIDAKDGKDLWQVALGPHVDAGLAPVSSPAVAEGRVFVNGTDCVLRALDAATGALAWQIDLKQRFGVAVRRGCESSPFVENGRVILQPGSAEHRLVALDARTGDLVWSNKGPETANYSSPVAADVAGARTVVIHHVTPTPPQKSGLAGIRIADGTTAWSQTLDANVSTETPLVAPGDRILLLTWNDAKLARLVRAPDAAAPAIEAVWAKPVLRSRIAPPVYRQGHVYGYHDDDLVCVSLNSGAVVWREKIYAGSVIMVDDKLVLLSATSGVVRVADASPAGYVERARVDVLNRGAQTEAPPSFAGDTVFVRNDEEIAAVVVNR